MLKKDQGYPHDSYETVNFCLQQPKFMQYIEAPNDYSLTFNIVYVLDRKLENPD